MLREYGFSVSMQCLLACLNYTCTKYLVNCFVRVFVDSSDGKGTHKGPDNAGLKPGTANYKIFRHANFETP